MRKIEQEMVKAIADKRNWKSGNTSVEYLPEIVESTFARIEMAKVYLHDNHIATFAYDTGLAFIVTRTLVEWPTVTTFSRLRALGLDPKDELERFRKPFPEDATFRHLYAL